MRIRGDRGGAGAPGGSGTLAVSPRGGIRQRDVLSQPLSGIDSQARSCVDVFYVRHFFQPLYRAHVPIRNSKFLKLLTFQMPKFPLVKNLRGKNSLDFPFLCTCRVTLTELQSRNSLTTELHTLSVPPASFTRASLFRLGFPCFRFGPAVAIGLQAPQGGRRASSRQEARARAQPEFDASTAHPCSSQCPLSYT